METRYIGYDYQVYLWSSSMHGTRRMIPIVGVSSTIYFTFRFYHEPLISSKRVEKIDATYGVFQPRESCTIIGLYFSEVVSFLCLQDHVKRTEQLLWSVAFHITLVTSAHKVLRLNPFIPHEQYLPHLLPLLHYLSYR